MHGICLLLKYCVEGLYQASAHRRLPMITDLCGRRVRRSFLVQKCTSDGATKVYFKGVLQRSSNKPNLLKISLLRRASQHH